MHDTDITFTTTIDRMYKLRGQDCYVIRMEQCMRNGIKLVCPIFFTYEATSQTDKITSVKDIHIVSNYVNIADGKHMPYMETLDNDDKKFLRQIAYQTITNKENVKNDSISENSTE